MVPQKYAFFARSNGQIEFPAGRVFGGTSTLSHLNYNRESALYFNKWSDLYGIKNWSSEEVLPFFMKAENFLDSDTGKGGPLSVSTVSPDPVLRRYLIAAEKLGFNESTVNGNNGFGPTVMPRTVSREAIALSTSSAYIESKPRPNLSTIGTAFVTRVLFDRSNRAIGVNFQKDGSIWTLKARKEIIICAGVVGSAQLLLLSGIGPKDHLHEMNVPLVSNLKVGLNLRHSLVVDLNYNIKDQKLIEKPLLNTDNQYEYYTQYAGPLAYIGSGVHCFPQVMDDTTGLNSGCVLPHIHFLSDKLDKLAEKLTNDSEWEDYYRPYLGHSLFRLRAVLRRPKSVGSLRLESNNPYVRPVLDPQVFGDQSDVDRIVDTMKEALRIYNSEHMSELIEPFERPVPGCSPCPDNYFCDSYLRCIAYTTTGPLYLVGSCRMGTKEDKDSVVDEMFRVRGVAGLRVVDASVLPVPTDQSMATVVMLAERGAAFIDEENRVSFKWPELKFNLTQISDLFWPQ